MLGVAPDASDDEVRSAYRHLVRDLHPDTRSPHLDPALADEALRQVQSAYVALTDPRFPSRTVTGDPRVTESEVVGFHGRPRFPWWMVAVAILVVIFMVTAYAGSVAPNN